MFTGLVQTLGRIAERSGGKLVIRPAVMPENPVRGESIAVNGCCLTLESFTGGVLTFHTLQESLRRTNLGRLPLGSQVNLERALRLGDPLGGHIVQGHVDTAAEVLGLGVLSDGDCDLRIALEQEYAPLVVTSGSVAVDGVSLTVAEIGADFFSVRLIPVTLEDTALAGRTPGTTVNLEFDILGRYILRQSELRERGPARGGVTMDTLREAGFL